MTLGLALSLFFAAFKLDGIIDVPWEVIPYPLIFERLAETAFPEIAERIRQRSQRGGD